MFIERLNDLRSWVEYELDWYKETKRFHRFFHGLEHPNGILTKTGETIHPFHRGLLTSEESFGLMQKVADGKALSEEELKKVEAARLTSLTGTYTLETLPETGVRVGITIGNDEALKYLSTNANLTTMAVFLSYWDRKHFRHKEASSIKAVQELDGTHLIFNFLQPQETPTEATRLFIYTRHLDDKDINNKFLRLNLLLGIPQINHEWLNLV